MGGKINIVNEKKNYFLRLRDFKLRSNLKENYINGCDFLIVRNSVRGVHCDFRLRRQKA